MASRCHEYWAGTPGAADHAVKLHIIPIIHAKRICMINAWRAMTEKRKLFGFTLAPDQTNLTMRHALDLRGSAVDVHLAAIGS